MRPYSYLLLLTGLVGVALAQGPPPVDADGPPDEPGRQVARLSILNGDAQVKRGDTGQWVTAAVNTPLMTGDSLAVGNNGRAEVQFDNAHFVRVAADTEIRLWNLEDNRIQIQVGKGMVTWRVLRAGGMQAEMSTQLAAVRPVGQPSIRLEVAPDGSTRIMPRNGEAEVFTQHGTERVREGNVLLVQGSAENPQSRIVAASVRDGWDQFNEQRDSFLTHAQSPRYASAGVYGTEDLDPYGRWMEDPAYGSVWSPNVAANWAPYRDGRWVWQDYYGWTWVDDAPWGWAPFHYGSWYYRTGYGWNWFPGGRDQRQYYRPALVAFFGGGGFNVGVGFGHVGWVPLAPFETYRPWYGRGWGGGQNNVTIINNTNIVNNTNIYNSYRNSRSYNGVTAVSAGDFQRGNYRHPVNLNRGDLESASLVRGGGPVAPTQNNLNYSDRGFGRGRQGAGEAANQSYFSKMGAPQADGSRTTFAEQQAAVRSGLDARGGGLGQGVRPDGNTGGFGSRGDRGNSPGFRQAPQNSPDPQPGTDRPAWQRFGAPAPVDRGPGNRIERQRIEPPQGGFGRQRDRNGAAADPRPLDVAPPVVRQREAEPGFNRRGGFGTPTPPPQQQQQQQQQQPRQQQERQAPPPFRGGGGAARSSDGDGPRPRVGDGERQARPEGGRGRSQF